MTAESLRTSLSVPSGSEVLNRSLEARMIMLNKIRKILSRLVEYPPYQGVSGSSTKQGDERWVPVDWLAWQLGRLLGDKPDKV